MYDNYADWDPEPLQRPYVDVLAPAVLAHPVGFIDFRYRHAKTEQRKNIDTRHCRIRSVKYKKTNED